jgi:hypothetical protein
VKEIRCGGRQYGKTAAMREEVEKQREQVAKRHGWREALRRVVILRPPVTIENGDSVERKS